MKNNNCTLDANNYMHVSRTFEFEMLKIFKNTHLSQNLDVLIKRECVAVHEVPLKFVHRLITNFHGVALTCDKRDLWDRTIKNLHRPAFNFELVQGRFKPLQALSNWLEL